MSATEPTEPTETAEPAETLRVVFMGTPDFAVAALQTLVAAGVCQGDGDRTETKVETKGDVRFSSRCGCFSVELVCTRPDAVSGRGKALVPSPVRVCAEELGIPVLTPRSFNKTKGDGSFVSSVAEGETKGGETKGDGSFVLSLPPDSSVAACQEMRPSDTRDACGERVIDTELIARIAAVEPDFIVVAAYGMILPRQVLELPRCGCVNIHASLLPRWRGAAPIQRALLAGDERAGVSIMRMEEGLDTGAYCAVASTAVGEKNATQLTAELATLGANLLVETLPRIAQGTAIWTEQDVDGVTYADKVQKRELALDPAASVEENLRRVRASTPQAPARCIICEKPVTVLVAYPNTETNETKSERPLLSSDTRRPPDTPFVASFIDSRLILATIDGIFEVISLKPDGKKEMSASAFAAGCRELQKGSETSATWRAIDQGSE